jgi:nicotinamide-nucleotide amidase
VNVWIVAVGSELLTPFRVDTNSLAITERLNAIGGQLHFKAVVGDRVEDLVDLFARAIGAVDLVVCTGGLGPTADDLTRDALARALDLPLEIDHAIAQKIQERFERRKMVMPEINRRQAMVPRGATALPNENGTAPGLWIERGPTAFLLLPGPPREMIPMLEAVIDARLRARGGGVRLFRRVLKITGRPESDVDALAAPVYGRWVGQQIPIATTILAVMGQIELHLTATAADADAAASVLDSAVAELVAVLGESVYSTDGRALEAVIGDLLRAHRMTIAVAESCSGGLLASRLTDVPGSSEYFDRGVVCYSNQAKVDLLGVPETLIAEHGAVSEPVAHAMAMGIKARAGAQVGIGITGIAGPGGATPGKPVGTVAVAVVTPRGERVRTFAFLGGRDMVKFQSAQAAMNMTRLLLGPIDSARRAT